MTDITINPERITPEVMALEHLGLTDPAARLEECNEALDDATRCDVTTLVRGVLVAVVTAAITFGASRFRGGSRCRSAILTAIVTPVSLCLFGCCCTCWAGLRAVAAALPYASDVALQERIDALGTAQLETTWATRLNEVDQAETTKADLVTQWRLTDARPMVQHFDQLVSCWQTLPEGDAKRNCQLVLAKMQGCLHRYVRTCNELLEEVEDQDLSQCHQELASTKTQFAWFDALLTSNEDVPNVCTALESLQEEGIQRLVQTSWNDPSLRIWVASPFDGTLFADL